MATEKKIICPLNGGKCIEDGSIVNGELVACRFWTHVLGKNPQTGETVDAADCAISFIPLLLIENTKEQRTTAAEINRMRNETVPQTSAAATLLAQLVGTIVERQRIDEAKQLGGPNGAHHVN